MSGRSGSAPCNGLRNTTGEKRTARSATRSLRPGAAGIFTVNRPASGKPSMKPNSGAPGASPARRRDRAVLTGSHNQMHVRRTAGEVLVDIAFPVRYDGHAIGRRQHVPGARRRVEPALRLLADRAVVGLARPPTAQCQFAGILRHHDVAPGNTPRRARGRLAHHLAGAYPWVAQEAREPHLPCSTSAKPPDARAGPLDQSLVQGGPPFSSRPSPNRPSPYSIALASAAKHRSTNGIGLARIRQQRCVHTIAAGGERCTCVDPDYTEKYFACGLSTTIALVDCSGCSWNSSDSDTPIRCAPSNARIGAWSSSLGQAG